MSSSSIRRALHYALLLTPAALLVGLVLLVGAGAWVTAILREPARYPDSPALVRTLTRAAYWHTRRHWHTVPECVEFDRDLLYRPRPGSCVFENAEFRTTLRFDGRGARRTPPPAAATDGPRPRLVVVGDSHAMGWGVEDSETFASYLASEHGYPTVNLAVSSYGTPRELLRLSRDFELAADDVVVIQYCDNDLEEGRHYFASASLDPFRPEDLQKLFDYRPARTAALPVAGVLLRLTWEAFVKRLGFGGAAVAADAPDPTATFLRVVASHPELSGHRVLVVAINGPGRGTHLSAEALAREDLPLVVPQLSPADFLDIDDHMRPRGHRAVAAAIDAAIRVPAPSR